MDMKEVSQVIKEAITAVDEVLVSRKLDTTHHAMFLVFEDVNGTPHMSFATSMDADMAMAVLEQQLERLKSGVKPKESIIMPRPDTPSTEKH